MNFGPFGGGGDESDFDDLETYVPEHLPAPGAFLDGRAVLTGSDHVAVHRLSHEFFEERSVYDMTFGYNLAMLNLDPRHPDAGFRYAEAEDGAVLRLEFTPTTAFCPQSDTLAVGAFRAWNGLADRHDYDLVRVRVDTDHYRSEAINDKLRGLETELETTGSLPTPEGDGPAQPDATSAPNADTAVPEQTPENEEGTGTDTRDHMTRVRDRLGHGDGTDEPDAMKR